MMLTEEQFQAMLKEAGLTGDEMGMRFTFTPDNENTPLSPSADGVIRPITEFDSCRPIRNGYGMSDDGHITLYVWGDFGCLFYSTNKPGWFAELKINIRENETLKDFNSRRHLPGTLTFR